jgi:hypothetical protein
MVSSNPSFAVLTLNGGTLEGSVTLTTALNWNGGTLQNGLLTLTAASVLNISGADSKTLVQTINNAGTVVFSGTGYLEAGSADAVINNLAGAVFDHQSDASINYWSFNPYLTINNAGTYRKSGGTGTSVFQNVRFNNTRSFALLSGTVEIGGDFVEAPTASLVLAIGGTAPGTGYGQVSVSGQVTLAGALTLEHRNGFRPSPGDRFSVLSFGSGSGDFVSINGLDYGNGLVLKPQFTRTALTLEAVQTPVESVPRLAIYPTWNSALVTWPVEFTNCELQFTTNLTAPEWLPVAVAGTNNFILDHRVPAQFFRLKAE